MSRIRVLIDSSLLIARSVSLIHIVEGSHKDSSLGFGHFSHVVGIYRLYRNEKKQKKLRLEMAHSWYKIPKFFYLGTNHFPNSYSRQLTNLCELILIWVSYIVMFGHW